MYTCYIAELFQEEIYVSNVLNCDDYMSRIFQVVSLILPIILVLFGSELLLASRYSLKHAGVIEKCFRRSTNPELIYEGNPGNCGNNSLGYPDQEYSSTKRPDVFRILVIGDSVAGGYGVSPEQSFPNLLRNELGKQYGDNIEVYNLSRSGYSTRQKLVLLEKQALGLAPDLIIWSYVLNDPAHPIFHNADGGTAAYYHKPKSHLFHFFQQKYFSLRESVLRKLNDCEQEFHKMLHCAYDSELSNSFERIETLTSRVSVPVLFLIHPNIVSFENYPYSDIHSRLSELAQEAGFYRLDLLKSYRQEGIDAVTLVKSDPWHPNSRGQQLAADAIFRMLSEENLIPFKDDKKNRLSGID